MEQCKLLATLITEKSQPAERISALEVALLRRFRSLRPQDQATVFKLMEGLAALTDLEN